jgi:hypothetical protein
MNFKRFYEQTYINYPELLITEAKPLTHAFFNINVVGDTVINDDASLSAALALSVDKNTLVNYVIARDITGSIKAENCVFFKGEWKSTGTFSHSVWFFNPAEAHWRDGVWTKSYIILKNATPEMLKFIDEEQYEHNTYKLSYSKLGGIFNNTVIVKSTSPDIFEKDFDKFVIDYRKKMSATKTTTKINTKIAPYSKTIDLNATPTPDPKNPAGVVLSKLKYDVNGKISNCLVIDSLIKNGSIDNSIIVTGSKTFGLSDGVAYGKGNWVNIKKLNKFSKEKDFLESLKVSKKIVDYAVDIVDEFKDRVDFKDLAVYGIELKEFEGVYVQLDTNPIVFAGSLENWYKQTKDAKEDITNKVWDNGICRGGTVENIVWKDGIFYNGSMINCEVENGIFLNGLFEGCTLKGGKFQQGVFVNCKVVGANIEGDQKCIWIQDKFEDENVGWKSGEWKGGWIYDPYEDGNKKSDAVTKPIDFKKIGIEYLKTYMGIFVYSATPPGDYWKGRAISNQDLKDKGTPKIWKNGVFGGMNLINTTFEDGVFESGIFYNGVFKGGVFKHGIFLGGIFKGGEFKGGIWVDGIWKGGKWNEKGCWIYDPHLEGNIQKGQDNKTMLWETKALSEIFIDEETLIRMSKRSNNDQKNESIEFIKQVKSKLQGKCVLSPINPEEYWKGKYKPDERRNLVQQILAVAKTQLPADLIKGQEHITNIKKDFNRALNIFRNVKEPEEQVKSTEKEEKTEK